MAAIALQAAACGSDEEPVAWVDANLPLNAECEVILDDGQSLATGLYDISAGSGNCARDYEAHLRIASVHQASGPQVRGTEGSDILMVHLVEVTLKGEDGKLIAFSDDGMTLANPFEQETGVSLFPSKGDEPSIASIAIQAIPATYTDSLTVFVGKTVLADIELFGSLTKIDGERVDIDFERFSYPIEICDGCLTACASETDEDSMLTDVCDDDAGQDSRVCFDVGC